MDLWVAGCYWEQGLWWMQEDALFHSGDLTVPFQSFSSLPQNWVRLLRRILWEGPYIWIVFFFSDNKDWKTLQKIICFQQKGPSIHQKNMNIFLWFPFDAGSENMGNSERLRGALSRWLSPHLTSFVNCLQFKMILLCVTVYYCMGGDGLLQGTQMMTGGDLATHDTELQLLSWMRRAHSSSWHRVEAKWMSGMILWYQKLQAWSLASGVLYTEIFVG